jgi:hypothetical protein
MSADNWAICPRCLSEATDKHAAKERRVAALYGKVPVEEFDAQRAALAEIDPEKFRTFREDYEFYGAEDGEVHASYSGGCTTCKMSVILDASKRFWPSDEGSR